jgi:hypothetical protein
MERKLATRRGRAIYRRRAATIEPVVGLIKAARGITRFRRRGPAAARNEWRFIATEMDSAGSGITRYGMWGGCERLRLVGVCRRR